MNNDQKYYKEYILEEKFDGLDITGKNVSFEKGFKIIVSEIVNNLVKIEDIHVPKGYEVSDWKHKFIGSIFPKKYFNKKSKEPIFSVNLTNITGVNDIYALNYETLIELRRLFKNKNLKSEVIFHKTFYNENICFEILIDFSQYSSMKIMNERISNKVFDQFEYLKVIFDKTGIVSVGEELRILERQVRNI